MDNLHQEMREGPTDLEVGHGHVNSLSSESELQTYKGLMELTVSRSLESDKLIIGDSSNDFHNSDFDITFEDVMMFDLQNIHDDFQTKPLIHRDFENMS